MAAMYNKFKLQIHKDFHRKSVDYIDVIGREGAEMLSG